MCILARWTNVLDTEQYILNVSQHLRYCSISVSLYEVLQSHHSKAYRTSCISYVWIAVHFDRDDWVVQHFDKSSLNYSN